MRKSSEHLIDILDNQTQISLERSGCNIWCDCVESRLPCGIFVVAAPPGTLLVPPFGSSIKPLIHSPDAVDSACVSGIRVIDNAVFQSECAHARPLALVCR